jgi:hypothetical protein
LNAVLLKASSEDGAGRCRAFLREGPKEQTAANFLRLHLVNETSAESFRGPVACGSGQKRKSSYQY